MKTSTTTKKSPLDSHLKSVANRVRTNLQKGNGKNLEAFYEASFDLNTVMSNAKYGKKAMKALARDLKLSTKSLYRMARVAKAWPEKRFMALAKLLNAKGWALTWSHFEVLATLPERRRDAMRKRALAKSMTVAELRTATSTKKPSAPVSEDVAPAPSPDAEIDITEALPRWVDEFENEVEAWRFRLVRDVENVSKSSDAKGVKALGDTVQRMETAAKAMLEMAEQLKLALADDTASPAPTEESAPAETAAVEVS